MACAPLVTASWICAIWQGVSSLVLQALVVSSMSSGWSVSYCLAPAIMASQKPPVALVRSVTLIFSVAAAALSDGAAALSDGAAALSDGAAVPPPLLLHALMSIAPAPSTTNAFIRIDMCVAPSSRICRTCRASCMSVTMPARHPKVYRIDDWDAVT